jgi:glucan biosynthesis protein
MEYFVGCLTTLITVFVINKAIKKNINLNTNSVRYTQASIFSLINPFYESLTMFVPAPKTQASKFTESQSLRVLFLNDKAYWINSNKLYEADVFYNGQVDESSTKEVDTMGMDDVQLKKTIFIVEKLREGLDNDFGYPGNKNF